MNRTINMVAVGTVLIILVVSFGLVSATSTTQPKMTGLQWAVYGETTLPDGGLNFHPIAHATTISSGGVEFDMPDATSSSPTFVNYLLNTYTVSLTEASTISATIIVETSAGTPTFQGNPLWTAEYGSGITPASVRLFIQSNLPTMKSGTGYGDLYNYWWADIQAYIFNSGSNTMTMTVTFNPADWSSIYGLHGNYNSSVNKAFSSALSNIKYVGLSFGSGSFFADGVGVDGNTGSATFQLISYEITP